MRSFCLFILLLFGTSILAQTELNYFKSLSVEVTDGHNIDKVYCDPNTKDIYYISFDRLYKYNDGNSDAIIDLSKVTEDDSDASDELEKAKNELYQSIYNEEKEKIEDEYGIDDAEDYYQDLITTETERRFEDEFEVLKDNFRYKRGNKKSNKERVTPIKSLTFLQDLSSHLIVDTVDSFFISINSGKSFFTQDKLDITTVDVNDVSLKKREIIFTSNSKLYLFNANDNNISRLDLSDYADENILATTTYYPYIAVLTDKHIHLLKQEEDHLIRVKKTSFAPKSTENYKIHYFSGKYIFVQSDKYVVVYNIASNTINIVDFNYYNIKDLTLKKDTLYLGTDLGFISYNLFTEETKNISLGLLPEQVYSLSVSKTKDIFVTNKYTIYELKQFKSMEELSKDKNLFAIMKKVQLTYPPLDMIINEAYRYNKVSRHKVTSMYSRSKVAPFMPILKLKYVKPMSNGLDSELTDNEDFLDEFSLDYYSNEEYSTSPYFEAFMYFDLSSWVFDIKEMRVNRLNSNMNEFREKLTYEITNYYNSRQVLEVLYILTNNLSEKLAFKMQILEQGILINSLTGKKFF